MSKVQCWCVECGKELAEDVVMPDHLDRICQRCAMKFENTAPGLDRDELLKREVKAIENARAAYAVAGCKFYGIKPRSIKQFVKFLVKREAKRVAALPPAPIFETVEQFIARGGCITAC